MSYKIKLSLVNFILNILLLYNYSKSRNQHYKKKYVEVVNFLILSILDCDQSLRVNLLLNLKIILLI